MRYYSDELKKLYDSEEDLVKAESEAKQTQKLAEESKKTLAKNIECANARVEEAYEKYEQVKQQASDIIKEARDKVTNILTPAKKEIEDAEHAKAQAIQKFNSKYGVYTTTYTGDKAEKEYNRIVNHFNNIFKDAWKPFSWFW